jgi:hypothetical protein
MTQRRRHGNRMIDAWQSRSSEVITDLRPAIHGGFELPL